MWLGYRTGIVYRKYDTIPYIRYRPTSQLDIYQQEPRIRWAASKKGHLLLENFLLYRELFFKATLPLWMKTYCWLQDIFPGKTAKDRIDLGWSAAGKRRALDFLMGFRLEKKEKEGRKEEETPSFWRGLRVTAPLSPKKCIRDHFLSWFSFDQFRHSLRSK